MEQCEFVSAIASNGLDIITFFHGSFWGDFQFKSILQRAYVQLYLIGCNCNEFSLRKHKCCCWTPQQGHNVRCFDHMDTWHVFVHGCQNHLHRQTNRMHSSVFSTVPAFNYS